MRQDCLAVSFGGGVLKFQEACMYTIGGEIL